jgi:hypothetical protein
MYLIEEDRQPLYLIDNDHLICGGKSLSDEGWIGAELLKLIGL